MNATVEPVPLTDEWSLWPVAGLRSAGLPADRVLALAGPADQVTTGVEGFAADGWFREALTWQNRALVQTWLADYAGRLRHGDGRLTRRSYREGVLARYVQRYTAKNDTIGFFGPIGWVRVDPDEPQALRVAGSGRECRRRTHLEAWAAQELADRVRGDRALWPYLPPQADTSARQVGDRLVRPRRPDLRLGPAEAAVWRCCDGGTTAAEILVRLRRERPELGFADVAEVLSVLGALVRSGAVTRGPWLPFDERMEQHLLDAVAAVPDAAARDRQLGPLLALARARTEVDAAAGDPDRLLAALDEHARQFQDLTTTGRGRGRTRAAARAAPLWTDAVADWDVTLGAGALDSIVRPLGMMLAACRWLTWRVRVEMDGLVADLLRRTANGRMSFGHLLARLAPELNPATSGTLAAVIEELHAITGKLLGVEDRAGERQLDGALLREHWTAAFAAPAPGWEAARMHSPDLMLAARDPAAVARGELRWVLGEIHVAVNTLDNRFLVVNQPPPGGLVERLMARSTRTTRYLPAVPAHWPDVTPRTYPPVTVHVPGRFVYWSLEPEDVLPRHLPRVPCGGLDVVAEGDVPVVTDWAGLRVPFWDFAGELLSFLVGNAFGLFRAQPEIPRVTIDRLVVQRRTWHLPVAVLTDGVPTRGAATLAARIAAAGAPRHVFVRLPDDPKPLFCDLHSEVLVRNVLRLLRRQPSGAGATLRVQEMLPGFDDLWLTGADGGRRTSEFRFVAVDEWAEVAG